MQHVSKVSVHGGHSGQFCHHARDGLEEVVRAYLEQGFEWVGITEHMPPSEDRYRYQDEVEAGLSSDFLRRRFDDYFRVCRELQAKYRGELEILAAFETEWYPGALDHVKRLMESHRPDYIVGSVHHVRGIGIDFGKQLYELAVAECGSMEALYCEYFDAQHQLLRALRPQVVGHFDLVRIFDPAYRERLALPEIQGRMRRNLAFMAEHGLILDLNLRGFHKGREQYPSRPVLELALEMGVPVVPGDDSHGVASVGRDFGKGVALLEELGAPLDWARPAKARL